MAQRPHFRFKDGEPEIVGSSQILEHIMEMWESSSGRGRDYVEWIMKEGKHFSNWKDTPEEVRKLVEDPVTMAQDQLKRCYANSQTLAIETDGRYKYYEGWAITKDVGIPMSHAFNVNNGEVTDLTYADRFQVDEYYGVHIPYDYIIGKIAAEETCRDLLRSYHKEEVL